MKFFIFALCLITLSQTLKSNKDFFKQLEEKRSNLKSNKDFFKYLEEKRFNTKETDMTNVKDVLEENEASNCPADQYKDNMKGYCKCSKRGYKVQNGICVDKSVFQSRPINYGPVRIPPSPPLRNPPKENSTPLIPPKINSTNTQCQFTISQFFNGTGCESCHSSCASCTGYYKNCTECYFGNDKVWENRTNYYRCRANGKIGYSAVAITGSILGFIGGLYYLSKKRKENAIIEERKKVLIKSSGSKSNFLNSHSL